MRILVGLAAAIALGACSPGTGQDDSSLSPRTPPEGVATSATRAANAAVAERLPLDDTSDFVDATRGLLAQLKQDRITDANGNTVWQVSNRDFIEGDSPDTVNPSLWRQELHADRATNNKARSLTEPWLHHLMQHGHDGFDVTTACLNQWRGEWII